MISSHGSQIGAATSARRTARSLGVISVDRSNDVFGPASSCWLVEPRIHACCVTPNVQDNRTRPSVSPTETTKLKIRVELGKEAKGGFRLIVELGLFSEELRNYAFTPCDQTKVPALSRIGF
jgi:hypothetical protein